MSYARKLMQAIAADINRPLVDFEAYIKALEENWYDTRDALLQVKDSQLFQLNFPARLVELIKQKVTTFGGTQTQQPSHQQQQPFTSVTNSNKSSSTGSGNNRPVSRVESLITQLRKKLGEEQFEELTGILKKIFLNIRNNLQEDKYRTVKKGNTLGRLYQHPEFVELLQMGGFEEGRNEVVMRKLDLSYLNQYCEELERNTQPKFDPFKASISSLAGSIENVGQDSTTIWTEKLAQLEKDRDRLMSTPVKNRDVKIYKFNTEASMIRMFEKEPEDNPNEDEMLFIQSIKENMRKLEEGSHFSSRRKGEYEVLLKRPCFSETLARVRLPDNTVFECKFSPNETLGTLVAIFEEHVVNKNIPYYLYMTPPVQKLEKKLINETFYNMGCVPRALFYFGSDSPVNGQILKAKSGGFFSFN